MAMYEMLVYQERKRQKEENSLRKKVKDGLVCHKLRRITIEELETFRLYFLKLSFSDRAPLSYIFIAEEVFVSSPNTSFL